MTMFLGGLVLFFLVHLAVGIPPLRSALVGRIGENGWKGVVALASFGGLFLVGYGWHLAPRDLVFQPSAAAIRLAPAVVSLAIVLQVVANVPSHLRRWLRHPMLIGIALWATIHLLANGGLRDLLFFGAFLAYSLYTMVSQSLRGKVASFTPKAKWDVIAIVIGVVAAGGIMHAHQWLFGVSPFGAS